MLKSPQIPIRALVASLVAAAFFVLPPGLAGDPPQVPCTDTSLPTMGCPDLTVDPREMQNFQFTTQTFSPSHCDVVEGQVVAGTRDLLRFTFATPNLGPGDLRVGAPSAHPEWFVYSSCHGHYHFRDYADYRLWTEDGYLQWTAARLLNPEATAEEIFAGDPTLLDGFVKGQKQGFCVIDIKNYVSFLPSNYHSCGSNQGISVGWADVYVSGLSGQYIDVTDVPAGSYWLEAEVNSEHLYQETVYSNNAVAIRVNVS